MSRMDFEYRKSAAEGATGFGLLIAFYDTLAGDLRRAAEAERRNDIAGRCREVNHALSVIGQLSAWVEHGGQGELASQLVSFYASLRCALMDAQARRSAQLLVEQMARVIELRECWRRLDQDASGRFAEVTPHAGTLDDSFSSRITEKRCHMSWSA